MNVGGLCNISPSRNLLAFEYFGVAGESASDGGGRFGASCSVDSGVGKPPCGR